MLRLLAGRDRLIGAMLLGNTLVNIGSSAFLTTVLVALVGPEGAIYATASMTVLLLIFAEVMPKTVAITYPDTFSLAVARIVAFFVAAFGPILFVRRIDRARRALSRGAAARSASSIC